MILWNSQLPRHQNVSIFHVFRFSVFSNMKVSKMLSLTPDLYELVLQSVSPQKRLPVWLAIDQCSNGLRIPFPLWRKEILRALMLISWEIQWEKLLMLINHEDDKARWKRVGMRIDAQPVDTTLAKLAGCCLTDDLSGLITMLHKFPRAVTCHAFPPDEAARLTRTFLLVPLLPRPRAFDWNQSYLFRIDDRYGINLVKPIHMPDSINP